MNVGRSASSGRGHEPWARHISLELLCVRSIGASSRSSYAAHGIAVQRVMTDNGAAYRSTLHALACRTTGIRHLRTRPYRPRTNGKAERLIKTMIAGWHDGAIYGSSPERAAVLDGWL